METFSRLLARPGQTLTCSFRYRHADGRWLWLEGVGTNLLDEPSVRAVAANFRDVTRQREDDRRKDEWISMLAHELRNPLAPLLTGLHVLRHNSGDRPAVEQAAAMMERQVRHLARLVDDLLDVSRVARGKIRLRRERLDLARLVRTTAADHRHALTEAGLELSVEAPETPVWLTGDATRLAQVLSNLLDNAVKFTDRGGRVAVKLTAPGEPGASAPGGSAELRVRDTGVGVGPELLPRLFEPFNQADRSLHRTKGGLGLGLALVKGLTELHGGTVRASSEGAGRGAEFAVRLPLDGEPAALSEPVPGRNGVDPASARAAAHPGGGRQPGRGRHAADAAGDVGARGAGGVHGAGRRADGGGVAAGRRAFGHRLARPGRLRTGARLADQPGHGPDAADRRHRLRQRGRPPPGPRERLRSPADQAGRPRRAAAAAGRAGVVARGRFLRPLASGRGENWRRGLRVVQSLASEAKEAIMRFTVTRPGGTKDAEFEAYARLLRQQGKDLSNLPRAPDPENPRRRRAHVWNTQEEAQQFADELKQETGENGWRVESTAAPPSNGPFGPVLIQLARRSDGSVLALHPLSLAMIREAFPNARPGAVNAIISSQIGNDFLKTEGRLSDVVKGIIPSLTGLSMDQLTDLGYAVIDADTERTWVYVPPASVAQGQP